MAIDCHDCDGNGLLGIAMVPQLQLHMSLHEQEEQPLVS
jgi:hypothetical protein